MKILQFIEAFPSLCKPYFVNTGEKVQYQDLLNEIDLPIATDGPTQENSKVWLLDYIKDASSEKLSTSLQFITAFKQRPAWGLDKKIVSKYLPDIDEKIYPEAIVCFHTILLPTVHSSKMHSSSTWTRHQKLNPVALVHHHRHYGRIW